MGDALLVVLGGAVAALAGYFQARVQHGWDREARQEARADEKERELRAQGADRDREVRARADVHAERAIAAADDVTAVLRGGPVLSFDARPGRDRPEERARYEERIKDLRTASVYLTEPVRHRVERDADLMDNAEEIAAGPTVRVGGRWVAWAAAADVRRVCGAFLRGEPIPSLENELGVALEELEAIEAHWLEQEDQDWEEGTGADGAGESEAPGQAEAPTPSG